LVPAQRERGDLSRAEVVATALRLIDSRGPAGCTVRALAVELGVTPMAIYWHVSGKEELFDAILDAVLATIPTDGLPVDPFEALATGARRYRAVFDCHPHVAQLLATRPAAEGPAALAIMAISLDLLAAAGLDGAERVCGYLLLAQFVMGSVLTEHAGQRLDMMQEALRGTSLPDAESRFEFGLSCILAGLRARASSQI
jgi:AcrR family transcriptional regulator